MHYKLPLCDRMMVLGIVGYMETPSLHYGECMTALRANYGAAHVC